MLTIFSVLICWVGLNSLFTERCQFVDFFVECDLWMCIISWNC